MLKSRRSRRERKNIPKSKFGYYYLLYSKPTKFVYYYVNAFIYREQKFINDNVNKQYSTVVCHGCLA